MKEHNMVSSPGFSHLLYAVYHRMVMDVDVRTGEHEFRGTVVDLIKKIIRRDGIGLLSSCSCG